MAEPLTIVSVSLNAAGFIKKYWKQVLICLFIISIIPALIITAVINILFPQVSKEEFNIYKNLTAKTGINWYSFMAYDTVRLDNYLKENNPDESVFDLLRVRFKEYEIIETEKQITKIVDGKKVTETITQKEYKVIRELEIHGYGPIKNLLLSLNYFSAEENMSVKEVTDFFTILDKKEEYEIETSILTDVDITEDFDDNHKQWYFALSEILPLIDPTAEFDPDEYIIPELSSNPSIPSIWPTQGIITSEFGENRIAHIHEGIDIANIISTPIYATADGTVIAVGSSGNFGKRIMIYHGTDESGTTYVTIYAHLSQFKVNVGDKITQGALVALMGNTGYSTGPHLHYEIRLNSMPINPRYFLQ
ncbi:MAG: M23 family metallopeptidase [Actinobacteria bacterium]|nr:M23 family metallopeptidase [Actinomycetota bacterium]